MPRLTALRIPALEELARQLRFAPASAIRRQLASAETLAREIDPAREYPISWLVFRLTGYRSESGDDETVLGATVLAEMSALAERLSEQGRLSMEDLGDDAIGLPELCERWGVTRKTIERRRRDGLIGCRVRDEEGRTRLAFMRSSVERYERARSMRVERGREFSRISDEMEARLARRAARYRKRLGWTLHQVSERLARRFGRSPEAVRRALSRRDASSDRPIFGARGPLRDREREMAMRAYRRGIEADAIGERLERTRASVHRIVNERRAALLRGLELRPARSEMFDREDADEVILAPAAVREGLGAPGAPDVRAFVEGAMADPPPDAAREKALAAAMALLRVRAEEGIAALARHNPRSSELDGVETMLRWASLLQRELARSQRRLVLRTIEERIGVGLMDLPDAGARRALALGMGAACLAAGQFDPFRGGRLAAATGLTVGRALGMAGVERAVKSAGARRSASRLVPVEDWTRRVCAWQAWLDPPARVREGLDRLSDRDRRIVSRRYGLDGAPPETAAAVGASMGLSSTRVTAIERRALRIAQGLERTAHLRRR